MIKDIVVKLPLVAERDRTTSFAASLAGLLNAHITGIAFVYDPFIPAIEIGAAVPASYLDEQLLESERLAQAAMDRLAYEVKREGVGKASHLVKSSSTDAAGRFAEFARGFDLAVMSQPGPTAPGLDEEAIEATLFESGRPILVVPYIQHPPFRMDHIVVAWDGSRAATRAIADALPLLHRAKRVDLLSVVGQRPLREELPGADMVSHLGRHGIKADVHKEPLVEGDVTPALLNYLADSGADLLVMGGYGHSRLREFVLGGATRDILRSMTVPVLLSH